MPKNSGAEYIIHCNAVRLRVIGSGNLDMTLLSLDDVRSFTLMPIVMTPTTAIEPTRLANFRSQRMKLRLSVDVLDEYFKISKIVLFAKTSATAYPG